MYKGAHLKKKCVLSWIGNVTGKNYILFTWYFRTVVLAKTLESPLDCKIKPVDPKGNLPWKFIGRTGAEAPKFGHLMQRLDSLEKTLMLGKTEGKRARKEATDDKMVGWHHWFNGHEFEQTLGDSKGQGSLACCRSWTHFSWNIYIYIYIFFFRQALWLGLNDES